MKNISIIISLVLFSSMVNGQDIFTSWKELSDYNEILRQAFDSVNDDDMEAAKILGLDINEKAEFLAKSKIPADFDNERIGDAINKLKTDSEAYKDLAESGSAKDEELKNSIVALHNEFNNIVKLCKAETIEQDN